MINACPRGYASSDWLMQFCLKTSWTFCFLLSHTQCRLISILEDTVGLACGWFHETLAHGPQGWRNLHNVTWHLDHGGHI